MEKGRLLGVIWRTVRANWRTVRAIWEAVQFMGFVSPTHSLMCLVFVNCYSLVLCIPNLKSLASVFSEILKGNPKILGSFPSPGPHPLLFWWDLLMELGRPHLIAKSEVASIIFYGNIREFVFKRQIRFFRATLWGELGVTYGLHP